MEKKMETTGIIGVIQGLLGTILGFRVLVEAWRFSILGTLQKMRGTRVS